MAAVVKIPWFLAQHRPGEVVLDASLTAAHALLLELLLKPPVSSGGITTGSVLARSSVITSSSGITDSLISVTTRTTFQLVGEVSDAIGDSGSSGLCGLVSELLTFLGNLVFQVLHLSLVAIFHILELFGLLFDPSSDALNIDIETLESIGHLLANIFNLLLETGTRRLSVHYPLTGCFALAGKIPAIVAPTLADIPACIKFSTSDAC